MAEPTVSKILHRFQLLIRNLLLRLPLQRCRRFWLILWRLLRRVNVPFKDSPTIRPEPGHERICKEYRMYTNTSMTLSDFSIKGASPTSSGASACYALHEPSGSARVPRFSGSGIHINALPYNSSVESDIALSDTSSDIAIQVFPPDPERSISGTSNPDPGPNITTENEHDSTGGGLLWRSSSETYYSNNDPTLVVNPGGLVSLSPHSSPKSIASSTLSRNISLQDFSVSSQPDGSPHVMVIPSALQTGINVIEPGSHSRIGSCVEISASIYPLLPSRLQGFRYDRERAIPSCENPEVEIRPNQIHFSYDNLPDGWVQHIQPEGQPTFYNPERNIITESWIWKPDIYNELFGFILEFEDFIRAGNFELPPNSQLVLDVEPKDDEPGYWCGYYYVCHSTPRSVFWLEKFDMSSLFEAAESEVHPPRIRNQLEYQYWIHWDLFPNVNKLTKEILDLMANEIRDARTDLITAPETTTINLPLSALKVWADIVKDAREHLIHGHQSPTSWFVGRFMSSLWQGRFVNFYGQYGARLSRKQSIHNKKKTATRTNLIKILSPMLFSAPNVHLTTMEGLWVDKLTLKVPWAQFFERMIEEWRGHTVYASILLNANVAFLAIPSNDSGDPSNRSPTQIASYLSIIASSASMMLALLLVRQHQTGKRSTAMEVNNFLLKSHHPTRGLETLAILYSLPYALLVWGMVTFFAAFFIMCFQNSTTATRFIVGAVCLLTGASVVWCIWMGWEEIQDHWWSRILKQLLEMWRNACRNNERSSDDDPDAMDGEKRIPWYRLHRLRRSVDPLPPDP